ncbi:MAG: DUF2927 domain-containing protein [Rhodobacter sp.]|nr:DUF2927 domain-containing protein [Rhodobacter sp.]
MPTRRPPEPRRRFPRTGPLAALTGAALLAGCASLGVGGQRPSSPIAPARPAEVLPTDPLSADLAAYYQHIEAERVSRNLMRTDNGTGEAAISAARLAEDYIDIALHEEHTRTATGFGGPANSVLRRWEVPVQYALEFGPSVSRATRLRDQTQVAQLAARLAVASGHAISVSPPGSTAGNFHVLILSESERRAAAPRLRQLVPGIDEGAVRLITDMPRETFCLVMAFSRDGSAAYSEAVAIIRAEHPDLTRLACYHEELTQGLGLASDSDRARPSIFNDDQEFALLTDHDLLLLRIHYDPRLRPGMTEATARPLIFTIASELVAGES